MTLVVDASVALRWYVTSPESEAALALLDDESVLVAPDLVVAELCNTAWKMVRAGEISEDHGTRIAAAAPGAFSGLVSAAALAGRAFALSRELDHPVYDCLYLTLAETESTAVVTCDQRLLRKLAKTRWQHLARPLGH